MTSEQREYLRLLRKYENKSQASYDKSLLLGSGIGALVVIILWSFAYRPDAAPVLLSLAYWSFSLSFIAVVNGHTTSASALRKEISDYIEEKDRQPNPADIAVAVLNMVSGAFFNLGVFLLAFFLTFGKSTS
jgi:hypothetical protein